MISSMTGFGKAVSVMNGFSFEIEVKSLNNRFLEISLKLPQTLQNKEYELKELIRNKIKRGKIYVTILIKKEGENGSGLVINQKRLEESIDALKKIRSKFKVKEKIKLAHILQFKDLFTPEMEEFDDSNFETLKNTLSHAIDNFIVMRNAEGAQLSKDLVQRIENITETVGKIEQNYRSEVEEYFNKLKERIKQLVNDITSYSDRLEVELALIADKSDITEECVRLKSHLNFFLNTIKEGSDVGRKLNFVCQEMHREANTISSKAISTEVSHLSVFIKEEIERIREQIQNIE
ncbi:MAG: YicC/YloC family endoribonuclease [Ignavibacteria bacterium]|nr:YicC/YloC family endoribonuclease [Ignavibacteria bacterium]MDP3830662.1 YicC/YloC family endoribonuclease [Ignavibacteriaceae bacterium]